MPQLELRRYCLSFNYAATASASITPLLPQLELRRYCLSFNCAASAASASITPEAFANFSPGFEHSENPGVVFRFSDATLKALANDAQSSPTLSALQRFVKTLTQGCANPGLKLANACGVI
jgi:tRNA U34 5-methylaminomethyl-2-thiouridine-forming methyltransferase MnmC